MKPRDKILSALIGVAALEALLCQADTSLAYTPSAPYGPLWVLLNPLYQTQLPYRLYLACFILVALGFMAYAVKKWGLPYRIAYLQALAVTAFAEMHIHQNITVVSFAWTAWFFWPLAGLAIQKFPIGWSLDLKDSHWNCLSTCFNYRDGATRAGWSHLFDRSSLHTVIYLMLIISIAYPVLDRIWQWLKLRRQPTHGPKETTTNPPQT